MVRRLTYSIALAAACVIGNHALAQEAATKAVSAKANIQMATYSSHYAQSASSGGNCASCNSGTPSYGFPSGNTGGPHAMAFGQVWGGDQANRDCSRFYHYPYVYYPQNFKGDDYFRSSDSMYYRYPAEMQIPVYNRHWHNYYPSPRRYHWGHHFILDVF